MSSSPADVMIFFDGDCAMCHATVRFLVRRSAGLRRFAFAPLYGVTFADRVPPELQVEIPDSIVVQIGARTLLLKSSAVLFAVSMLPGAWGAIGRALSRISPPFRDAVYDVVARFRKRWFAPPKGACPLPPGEDRGVLLP